MDHCQESNVIFMIRRHLFVFLLFFALSHYIRPLQANAGFFSFFQSLMKQQTVKTVVIKHDRADVQRTYQQVCRQLGVSAGSEFSAQRLRTLYQKLSTRPEVQWVSVSIETEKQDVTVIVHPSLYPRILRCEWKGGPKEGIHFPVPFYAGTKTITKIKQKWASIGYILHHYEIKKKRFIGYLKHQPTLALTFNGIDPPENVKQHLEHITDDRHRRYLIRRWLSDRGYWRPAFDRSQTDKKIRITVQAGTRYRLHRYTLPPSYRHARKKLLLKPGEIVTRTALDADEKKLRRQFSLKATDLVIYQLQPAKEHPQKVNISWIFIPRTKRTIEYVTVDTPKYSRVKPRVVKRDFRPCIGKPLNAKRFLRSRRRLTRQPYIKKTDIRAVPGISRQGIGVDIKAHDTQAAFINAGVGYSSSVGLFSFLHLIERNFLGNGVSVFSRNYYGQYVRLFELSFQDPWLFDKWYTTFFYRTPLALNMSLRYYEKAYYPQDFSYFYRYQTIAYRTGMALPLFAQLRTNASWTSMLYRYRDVTGNTPVDDAGLSPDFRLKNTLRLGLSFLFNSMWQPNRDYIRAGLTVAVTDFGGYDRWIQHGMQLTCRKPLGDLFTWHGSAQTAFITPTWSGEMNIGAADFLAKGGTGAVRGWPENYSRNALSRVVCGTEIAWQVVKNRFRVFLFTDLGQGWATPWTVTWDDNGWLLGSGLGVGVVIPQIKLPLQIMLAKGFTWKTPNEWPRINQYSNSLYKWVVHLQVERDF